MVRYRMGSSSSISLICTVMVLNSRAMNWFDFQNDCRTLGQEMPSAIHHKKPYWTKYYKRQSQWIGKYGCYNRIDLKGNTTFHLHLPSAGLCQELCTEADAYDDLFFFGVQERKCICLRKRPTSSSIRLNQCNFDCLINYIVNDSFKCREGSVYSVFVSKKGRPDMICNQIGAHCYHKDGHDHDQQFRRETICNTVNENNQDKCVIELTTQIYTSYDRGKELSISDKTSILLCQQCIENECLFANCTSHMNNTNCTEIVLPTAHISVWKTIKPTMAPNVTEKRVSLMWITYNKLASRYKKQTLLIGGNIFRTTQSTSKEDTITDNSMTIIVGGLVSSTVICFLSLMAAIYSIRRKNIVIEAKCSTPQQIECSKLRYEQTSFGKLPPQSKSGHQNVTGASYYELADNSKLSEIYSNNKDSKEPYYDMIKDAISRNDVYTVANSKCSNHQENSYGQILNVNESNYSYLNAVRNLNSRIVNDPYGHI